MSDPLNPDNIVALHHAATKLKQAAETLDRACDTIRKIESGGGARNPAHVRMVAAAQSSATEAIATIVDLAALVNANGGAA